MLYPKNFEQKIDFLTIRRILKEKCISSLGGDEVDLMEFSTNFQYISKLLNRTDEMLKILTIDGEELPIDGFVDIREALHRLRIEGMYFDETEIFGLWRALQAVKNIVTFFTRKDEIIYPNIKELLPDVVIYLSIVKRIEDILNKFGKIKDNATSELARIRQDLNQTEKSVSRTLHSILKQAQAEGFVEKDATPTMREGRLVIPVSPAFKRKISGIVHDESATGKTVFIEPQQVVEANNRIRELEGEERREILRILVEFTDFLRPYFGVIKVAQEFLGQIDFLRAKALFATELNAIKPRLDNVCILEWYKAKHPLLYLNLRKQKKDIVPLDIKLNHEQRILLISGPNAGGKSVCLKTVAMLQYMLQCGLLIPVHDSSRVGVFDRLFIDIGDEQSIENDLSTYSSHLLNMKFFIKNMHSKTLFLIDEFGTGTEPLIGGALAEAILNRFNQNNAFGVVTTHYTNLKHFAEDAQGVVNGAMLYDRQHLQALFVLQMGNPGSSFAVEIARKIGLPEDIIQDATEKTGAKHIDYDKHLQDIVRDKRYWENKRKEIRQKEKMLEETISKYESEMKSIDKQRKELIGKAKQDAQNLLTETNATIENTIRKIVEAKAEKSATKNAREDLNSFKQKILNNPVETPFEVPYKQGSKDKNIINLKKKTKLQAPEKITLKSGDLVKIKGQDAIGKIIKINDNQCTIAFGALKSTQKLTNLEPVSNNQAKKDKLVMKSLGKTASIEVRQRKLDFKNDVDLRGMRADDALQAITYFIDDAVMVGVSIVRILHGTGTGALRQLVRQYVATIPQVKSFRDEHVQFGGAGITVVELE